MRPSLALVAIAAAGCGRVGFDTVSSIGGDASDDTVTDANDVLRPLCTTPFFPPQVVSEFASPYNEFAPDLSEDGLELIWHDNEPAGMGFDDLWFSTRATTADPFPPRAPVPNVNSSLNDGGASVSRDGLELFFSSERVGGGNGEIYVARRADRGSPFSAAQRVVELSSPGYETSPALSPDGLTLYFASDRAGGAGLRDLWFASRLTTASPFGAPVNMSTINTNQVEASPMITANGLTLVYEQTLLAQTSDIYIATRPSTSVPFSPGNRVDEVSRPTSVDFTPSISASGERIAFSSDMNSNFDLYIATRVCP